MSHSSEKTADIPKGSITEAAFEERTLRLTKRMAQQVPLRLKKSISQKAPGASERGIVRKEVDAEA